MSASVNGYENETASATYEIFPIQPLVAIMQHYKNRKDATQVL